MIEGQSVAAIIPARAGSKGLPGKNTLQIAGRPLIEWTIAAAKKSCTVDTVIVSSDDSTALAAAKGLGALALPRPKALSTDTTPTSEVLRHVHAQIGHSDIFVLLQPTSPLRTSIHIDEALILFANCDTAAVVSVCKTDVLPELMYRTDAVGRLQPVVPRWELRRQEASSTYQLNGAIYAASVSDLVRVDYRYGRLPMTGYVMPQDASVDIDDAQQFELARSILEARSQT